MPVVDGGGGGVVFSLTVSGVRLEGLTIRNKGTASYGILVSSSGCTLINNVLDGGNSGIKISGGSGNTVDGNRVSNATMGIFAYNTKNNVVRNNDLYKNVIGLRLYGATGNTITGNYAHVNAVGLQADDAGSKSNTIYLNDFVGNTALQAYVKGANTWTSGTVKYIFGGKTFTGKLGKPLRRLQGH